MLRRKKQQRPIEGTRTRCMRGSSPKASVECTARHHDVLHSSLFFFVCDRAQAAATPSAHVSLGRPQSPCVVYSIHGLVALLLRFSVVVVGAVEPLAAQAFERARLWHLHAVPPTRSSLLVILRKWDAWRPSHGWDGAGRSSIVTEIKTNFKQDRLKLKLQDAGQRR